MNKDSEIGDKDTSGISYALADLFERETESGNVQLISSSDYLSSVESRYEIGDIIGKGGEKKIYKVFDNYSRRYLAMAVPNDEASDEGYERFIHEAWLIGQLDHTDIIKVHDVGNGEKGIPYFTMDLKTGLNLEELMVQIKAGDDNKQAFFTEARLLDVFNRILDAMAYSHSMNILHLDLKPANIQVGEFGEVVVCDWSLARVVEQGENGFSVEKEILYSELMERYGSCPFIKGTPGYMAPEMISKNESSVCSDVYSLGSILYYMLTKESHVSGGNTEVMDKTVTGDVAATVEYDSGLISEGLRSILKKALALKKEDRYQSVEEFRMDIIKFKGGYLPSAESKSVIKEIGSFYRRNKLGCLQALFSILILLGLVVGFIIKLEGSYHAELKARKEAEESLFLYEKQKSIGNDIKRDYAHDLIHAYAVFGGDDFYESPAAYLTKALKGYQIELEQNPENEQTRFRLGIVLFMLQRFREADKYVSDVSRLAKFRPGIEAVRRLEYEMTAVVPVNVLATVLEAMHLSNEEGAIYRMIAYDQKVRKNFTDYELVVKNLMHVVNPNWLKNGFFNYDKKSKSLLIRGKGFHCLRTGGKMGIFPLVLNLPISLLDIRDTRVHDLADLNGSIISALDIRDTKITKLSPIVGIKGLETLIVKKGQFKQEELMFVPKSVNIVAE